MLAAYRGTTDDEGGGPDEAAKEIELLLGGAYGRFNTDASEVVETAGILAHATLVTEFQGAPLIAFSMTDPAWKRRGLARAALLRTMDRLRRAGQREVHLVVTAANTPALALYESLGFIRWTPETEVRPSHG
jgi:RimJ/RimL family protein N-acetyltransferase